MAEQERYLLTVDAETGRAIKIEHVGKAGDLTEVPLEGMGVVGGAIQVVVGSPSDGERVELAGSPPGGKGATPGCIFQGPQRPEPPKPPKPSEPGGEEEDGEDHRDLPSDD